MRHAVSRRGKRPGENRRTHLAAVVTVQVFRNDGGGVAAGGRIIRVVGVRIVGVDDRAFAVRGETVYVIGSQQADFHCKGVPPQNLFHGILRHGVERGHAVIVERVQVDVVRVAGKGGGNPGAVTEQVPAGLSRHINPDACVITQPIRVGIDDGVRILVQVDVAFFRVLRTLFVFLHSHISAEIQPGGQRADAHRAAVAGGCVFCHRAAEERSPACFHIDSRAVCRAVGPEFAARDDDGAPVGENRAAAASRRIVLETDILLRVNGGISRVDRAAVLLRRVPFKRCGIRQTDAAGGGKDRAALPGGIVLEPRFTGESDRSFSAITERTARAAAVTVVTAVLRSVAAEYTVCNRHIAGGGKDRAAVHRLIARETAVRQSDTAAGGGNRTAAGTAEAVFQF